MRFSSVISANHHGWRLGDLLPQHFTYHSAERWDELLAAQCVWLNDAPATAQSVVHRGDTLVYIAQNYTEPPVCTDFELIYEDEDFVVVGKPADVPVHKTGRIFWNTFTAILRRSLQEPELVPLHRLDRDTSGIMLYARSADSAKRFQRFLPQFMLRKIYVAVVDLATPAQAEFWAQYVDQELRMDAPLTEISGGEIRLKMGVDAQAGKPSTTLFRFLGAQNYTPPRGVARRVGVVQAELLTGRKHQIRAHLAHLGTPIVGDPIYSCGGKYYLQRLHAPWTPADIAILGSPTQMLHAQQLLLHLPAWNEPRWLQAHTYSATMAPIMACVDLQINA